MAYQDTSIKNWASLNFGQTNQTTNNQTKELGKDDFLKLLVTQLQYQDPLKPMEDKEFIAQTAQFSALEQMQNINDNFGMFMKMQSVSNAASLIGKEVTYLVGVDDDGEVQTLTGEVTEVMFANGDTYMTVNGEDIPLDLLLTIKEPTEAEPGDGTENDGDEGADDGTDDAVEDV